MSTSSSPYVVGLPGGVPSTHREHTESRTTILLPNDNTAFLNPPQQFNRDLSVAVIRAWNEQRIEKAKAKQEANAAKGKGKNKKNKARAAKEAEEGQSGATEVENGQEPVAGPSTERKFQPRNIRIIEALSATGLRSIRYAKEIPNVKVVLANDLSPSACDAMRVNVRYNGVEEVEKPAPGAGPASNANGTEAAAAQAGVAVDGSAQTVDEEGSAATQAASSSREETEQLPNGRRPGCKGGVRVNEGDACSLMYSHRDPKNRVEVVDLDPYGTAAPFIDAAISCVADGGLMCVTCTDTAVFAGHNYPEKSFANYGGASVNAEYCHEAGLRLVLNSLAQAAARYGRVITPLLSLSIDFYVRCFVMVDSAPVRVKELASQTGIVFVCSHCQSFELQPFGREVERKGHKLYKTAPKTSPGKGCLRCGSSQQVGGPMWLGPIQDSAFAERCLKSIEGQEGDYATWKRMHGMLSLAKEELADPFYFSCNKISSYFKASSAPTHTAVSALLNAGYNVSRSHALAGSLKTNAPIEFVHDIMREYIKTNPVKMSNIPDGNPAKVLLAKPQTHTIDLTPHPDASKLEKGEKVVYYQANPLPNWGPAARARTVKAGPGPGGPSQPQPSQAQTVLSVEAKSETAGEPDAQKRKADVADEVPAVKKAKVEDEGDADEEEAMNMA